MMDEILVKAAWMWIINQQTYDSIKSIEKLLDMAEFHIFTVIHRQR